MKTVWRRTPMFVMMTAVMFVCAGTTRAEDRKAPAIVPPEAVTPAVTPAAVALKNLMDAYNREANSREHYLAAARKADQEGYRKVAELFRGAAKSQDIHLGFYAKNITKLGGTPAADIQPPLEKSTADNLADAIKEIDLETGTLYPNYLAQAKLNGVAEASMSFHSGMAIRGNQRLIFQKAFTNLSSWKKASGGFYVCKVCGNLVEKLNFATCPVCAAPLKEFAQVK